MRTSRRKAFTLIELLIVVVIIAVLVAIAITNMIYAKIRANIGRVTGDLAAMYTSIETYRLDTSEYPGDYLTYMFDPPGFPLPPGARRGDPGIAWNFQWQMRILTTPVPYISAVPRFDPFRYNPTNNPFYSNPNEKKGLKYNQQYFYLNDGDAPHWNAVRQRAANPPARDQVAEFPPREVRDNLNLQISPWLVKPLEGS